MTAYTHGFVGFWCIILVIVGLKAILKVKTRPALVAAVVATALTMPLLRIFAR